MGLVVPQPPDEGGLRPSQTQLIGGSFSPAVTFDLYDLRLPLLAFSG